MATTTLTIASTRDATGDVAGSIAASWGAIGVGNIAGVGPGDPILQPSVPEVVIRGYVPDGSPFAACAGNAMTELAVTVDIASVNCNSGDDYLLQVVNTATGLELPILTYDSGLAAFGAEPGIVARGRESAGSPPAIGGESCPDAPLGATFDASGLTLADIGNLSINVVAAIEGGDSSTVGPPVATLTYDDTGCPTVADSATMVVPVNARLRQCDLDYLAEQINAGTCTVRARHQILEPGENLGFIGNAAIGDVRSITVHVIDEPVSITDGAVVNMSPPCGSYTWSATGDTETTNGLIRAVAVPAGSTGRAYVQWTECV